MDHKNSDSSIEEQLGVEPWAHIPSVNVSMWALAGGSATPGNVRPDNDEDKTHKSLKISNFSLSLEDDSHGTP
jgi:hypothetical protein